MFRFLMLCKDTFFFKDKSGFSFILITSLDFACKHCQKDEFRLLVSAKSLA